MNVSALGKTIVSLLGIAGFYIVWLTKPEILALVSIILGFGFMGVFLYEEFALCIER